MVKTVYYEITSACPGSCPHCHVPSQLRRHAVVRSFPDITVDFMILRESLGVTNLILSGGEPTLHPEAEKVVKLGARIFDKVAIISNAILPDKLKDLGDACTIWASLDFCGTKQDDWRKLPGLWSNYQSIADLVNVRATLLQDNLEDVRRLIECATNHDQKITIVPYKGEDPRYTPSPKQLVDVLRFIFGNGHERRAVIDEPCIHYWLATRDRELMKYARAQKSLCAACESIIRVNVFGEVQPCPFLSDVIGDLRDAEIANKIRATRQKLLNTYTGKCQECANKALCGGCRASANQHCFLFTP